MPQKTEDTLLGERLESLMLEQRLRILGQSPKKLSLLESVRQQFTDFSKKNPMEIMWGGLKDTSAKGLGILETGANIFSSAYGMPLSGLAGLAASPFGKGPEAIEAIQNALISRPKTEAGQELSNIVSYPFRKLTEEVAQPIAGKMTEAWGPEIGTVAGTAIEASPLLLGLKGRKGKAFTTKEQMQINLAKEGFPISKGTLLEKVAKTIPPGSRFFKKQREVLNEVVLESNKQFVTEELGLPSPQLRPQLKGMQTEAWGKLREAMPKDQLVKAPNIEKWINENLSALPRSEKWLTNNLQNFINEVIETNGFVKYHRLTDLPGTLWGKNYNKLPPALKARLGELRQALGDDFQYLQQNTGTMAIPRVYDLFEGAMETSKLGHRINLSSFIEKLLNESTTFNAEREIGIFNPAQFKSKIEANMGRMQSMLPKGSEIPGLVQNYADKMMLTAQDLATLAKEKGAMGELVNKAGQIVTRGSPAILGPLATQNPMLAGGLAVPWGFETAMAHSLAHPRGWLRKFVFRETRPFQGVIGKAVATGTVMGIPQQFEEEYGMPVQ